MRERRRERRQLRAWRRERRKGSIDPAAPTTRSAESGHGQATLGAAGPNDVARGV
jgi:hypothetical protein